MGMKVKLRELFINSYLIVQNCLLRIRLSYVSEGIKTMKTMTHKTK